MVCGDIHKMVPVRLSCSTFCALSPHVSVNNDFAHHKVYVRAEIIYSTVYAITKHSFGHRLLCVVPLYELYHESPDCCCMGAMLE